VNSDLENTKKGAYLLVIDTEGLSVESSIAGLKFPAENIAQAIKDSEIEDKVNHRKLIIPEFAVRMKGEIEAATGWKVLVGPRDSSGIPKFLAENWK